jgi:hypothetical protein
MPALDPTGRLPGVEGAIERKLHRRGLWQDDQAMSDAGEDQVDTQRVVDALQRYVFQPGETVQRSSSGPGAVSVRSSRMYYRAGQADWELGADERIGSAVRVVGIREPMVVTHGLLLPADGSALHLNRPEVMADLGGWVDQGLAPIGYAQMLAELYSDRDVEGPVVYPFAATEGFRSGWLVRSPDHFSGEFRVPDAPPVSVPSFDRQSDGGWLLRFWSHNYYLLEGLASAVDVYEWEVVGASGRPATWSRKRTGEQLRRR